MTRRTLLAAALALAAPLLSPAAQAQGAKLKIGLMLPYSGTYAALGTAIENGFRLQVAEQGGKLAGRELEFFKVDDESDPAKATENVNKLIKRDNVDVIVGTVHSGVAMAMARAAKESGTLLVVPNAGADAVTGAMCAQNIFRSSFSNWQPAYAMGEVAARQEKKKRAITITWKYAAGDESANAFKEGFEKNGGQVVKQLTLPFPNVEFQALLTEIAAQLKLTWTAGAPPHESAPKAPVGLVSPAAVELEELHRAALTGNMRAIRDMAGQIAHADPACATFCEKLQALATAYQSKAILSLVKEHLDKVRAG